MMRHHEAFDELRNSDVPFIGEHIWNFADFLTIQRKLSHPYNEYLSKFC